MEAKIQSSPRARAKRVTVEGCTGLFWCCARCRRRGMQNSKIDICRFLYTSNWVPNVINLDFSFKTRILSSSNSSGVLRSGSETVSERSVSLLGWFRHCCHRYRRCFGVSSTFLEVKQLERHAGGALDASFGQHSDPRGALHIFPRENGVPLGKVTRILEKRHAIYEFPVLRRKTGHVERSRGHPCEKISTGGKRDRL